MPISNIAVEYLTELVLVETCSDVWPSVSKCRLGSATKNSDIIWISPADLHDCFMAQDLLNKQLTINVGVVRGVA